jgi:hypothetical protein
MQYVRTRKYEQPNGDHTPERQSDCILLEVGKIAFQNLHPNVEVSGAQR